VMGVQLSDGDVANFNRSLEMLGDALTLCQTYFEKQSESMAAMHASTKVMYSPICTLLADGLVKVAVLRAALDQEVKG